MRRTGRSQLKQRRKAARGCHARISPHTSTTTQLYERLAYKEVQEIDTSESEQGYHATTEVMKKRVLDMQPKVMSQACHVVVPRPIVDNMQPKVGSHSEDELCHVVVPSSSSVVDNILPGEGGQRMSVFIQVLMGLWRFSLGHMMYVTGAVQVHLGRKISRLHFIEASKAAFDPDRAMAFLFGSHDLHHRRCSWVERFPDCILGHLK